MPMQNSGFGSLQMGSRGPGVAAIQTQLNALLTPSPRLVADGVFGMKTAQAVKMFQQRRGLPADGIVGANTAAALGLTNGGLGGQGGGSGGGGVLQPPRTPPGPPGFVDLSAFNVVIEAIISGFQKVASSLLSWIDSDFVPQVVFDRVEGEINGLVGGLASQLRSITKQAVALGQDPATFVTGRIRDALARSVSSLANLLQPLVGLPVIGGFAARYQGLLRGVMSSVDVTLGTLRGNMQHAQIVATRIAAIFEEIARQIR
ncbi:MAG: peptidoglycan-binding protein [Rhizobacter sp.]|nr:peptidoglycan-binding protein [Burkholderiales bacterium]